MLDLALAILRCRKSRFLSFSVAQVTARSIISLLHICGRVGWGGLAIRFYAGADGVRCSVWCRVWTKIEVPGPPIAKHSHWRMEANVTPSSRAYVNGHMHGVESIDSNWAKRNVAAKVFT